MIWTKVNLIFSMVLFCVINSEEQTKSQRESINFDVPILDVPFMVNVKSHLYEDTYCSGVFLSFTWVLTAAHCFCRPYTDEIIDLYNVEVRVGTPDWTETAQSAKAKAMKLIRHENYNFDTRENDIGLIEVPTFKIFILRYYQNRPYIITQVEWASLFDDCDLVPFGEFVVFCGWGVNDKKETRFKLKCGYSTVIYHDECTSAFGNRTMNNMFCVGGPPKTVCLGDSGNGGPVIKGAKVIGISIAGDDCPNHPNVYLKISPYREWIRSHTSL